MGRSKKKETERKMVMQSKHTSKPNGKQQLGKLVSELDRLAKEEGRKYVELINYVKEHGLTREQLKDAFVKTGLGEASAIAEATRLFRYTRPYKDIEEFLKAEVITMKDLNNLHHSLITKVQRKAVK